VLERKLDVGLFRAPQSAKNGVGRASGKGGANYKKSKKISEKTRFVFKKF
jgi:hypothetical protein